MDETEDMRRLQQGLVNTAVASMPDPRKELEAEFGQVWDTQELQRDFEVLGFMAPYVMVDRISDKVRGTLMFSHSPRLYFNFVESGAK